jgi:hypothetical protein
LKVIPGRHLPDQRGGIHAEQFALADGKGHWNDGWVYLLGREFLVEKSVRIAVDGGYHGRLLSPPPRKP